MGDLSWNVPDFYCIQISVQFTAETSFESFRRLWRHLTLIADSWPFILQNEVVMDPYPVLSAIFVNFLKSKRMLLV